ncbi:MULTISPECIES: UDP-N-acetylglucosamine 1-carboxyvinyltransferase [unclassified Rhizobium]|jgi:UDP-N-acetylglucosamine 1-carboxyvinyltransferase|uniref:UDP-N-acetylglucosamine 1-carboxyvinyltransferase n=1 Tax=unclassified Rhizobium TaxID=2613769 RepID=UPI0006472248|nr:MULTISPECIES: UDP-N-acetylglucosamine 1-carboxyvinyltransferase [unclassified Rhizobium]MBN8953819.1 UDP-N-acetylglucosamine 1-carboxyvinyltransferase [Rhizobium tropici]OJY72375.1 MAG: UDP-N-acetylglucosamine 1-carboxyvinyltransferase [Rhizobium sp. 60-20]RKD50888.1 UDP-N-acetylglucosamine 1-carboxyvinyltransferase [Rhizobium sp. WW_1]
MARALPHERIQYVVEGGFKLSGEIEPSGNKNAALPIIAASLLTDQRVELSNVPRIRDVEALVELIQSVGAKVRWLGRNELEIEARELHPANLDPDLCARIRASILLAGPMLARCGEITLPPPGGDVIGRRRVDTHFLALEQLGTRIEVNSVYSFRTEGLRGADVFLDEPSVTATENALCAAVFAEGTTILRNCASEPHVQDLARFLIAMGARIEGVGTNMMTIHGGQRLGGASHRIGPDHNEVGSLIGLAAVTGSEITIRRAGVEHLRSTLMTFERLGIRCQIDGDDLIIRSGQEMKIQPDFGGHIPKIEDQPWPAFPADTMSIAIVTASQCDGVVLMFEKMFESRMFFVDKLIAMGARIVLCDPHRAIVAGPSKLRAAQLESPDIRAGMAMLIAAMCAEGTSVINNAQQIERGYERIEERLNALGARITRIPPREA